jgi:lipopolysaccharide heptosyltransferase I
VRDYRRILLIKPSSLGDIVHTLPTVAALRARFPDAHLAWLVKKQWAGIVERVEGVDRVWPVEGGVAGWLKQVPALRAAAFDLVVDLQGLFRSAAMAWLTGCSTRIGFANGREGSPLLYTMRVPVPTPEMHAVDRYLLVAQALGAARPLTPVFRFAIADADRARVAELLERVGVERGSPWVAMHVSARWPTKRWPAEFFAAVANCLQRDGVGPVVLIGTPGGLAEARAVVASARSVRTLIGLTPIELLPALLESATVLVSTDSGPMHVAAAVGTPVVALFGPTSPIRTGPYGARHTVLTHAVACRPCFRRVCHNRVHLECLTGITPQQVLAAVRKQVSVGLARAQL